MPTIYYVDHTAYFYVGDRTTYVDRTAYFYVGDRTTYVDRTAYFYIGDRTTYVVDKHHDHRHEIKTACHTGVERRHGLAGWLADAVWAAGRPLCGAAGRTGGDGSWGLYTLSRDDAAPPI